MDFTLSEKLAIIKMIDSVIIADDVIRHGETNFLNQLIRSIGFETNFLFHAKNLDYQEGILMLKEMSRDKKSMLREILHSVSKADGFIHKKETDLIAHIFSSIEIEIR